MIEDYVSFASNRIEYIVNKVNSIFPAAADGRRLAQMKK